MTEQIIKDALEAAEYRDEDTSLLTSLKDYAVGTIKYETKKYLTDIFTNYVKGRVNGLSSSLTSRIGTKISLTRDWQEDAAENLLYKIAPNTFLRNAESGTSSNNSSIHPKLKSGVNFTIILPEYHFLSVDKVSQYSGLSLFVVGPNHAAIADKINEYIMDEGRGGRGRSASDDENEMGEDTTIRVRSLSYDSNKHTLIKGRSNYVNAKPLRSIFTKEKNKSHLENYLSKWLKAQDFFEDLNISHKLGILLYGPPGTGKTSIAKTIAYLTDATLYTMNMSTFPAEVPDFSELVEEETTAIVLFEDIDYFFAEDNHKEQANALLQVLDGVNSVNGLIFIATTNDKDALSKALVRDGRFDLKIEMEDIVDISTAKEMCSSFKLSSEQVDYILSDETLPINPAAIQNKCIQYIFSNLETWLSDATEGKIEDEINLREEQKAKAKRKNHPFFLTF